MKVPKSMGSESQEPWLLEYKVRGGWGAPALQSLPQPYQFTPRKHGLQTTACLLPKCSFKGSPPALLPKESHPCTGPFQKFQITPGVQIWTDIQMPTFSQSFQQEENSRFRRAYLHVSVSFPNCIKKKKKSKWANIEHSTWQDFRMLVIKIFHLLLVKDLGLSCST